MDYDPEFPHRAESMAAIRALWAGWLFNRDPHERDALAVALSDERVRVCHGPGPVWDSFADTLPGYAEIEARFTASVLLGMDRTR